MNRLLLALAAGAAALSLAGCAKEGCLTNDPACHLPPPCPKVKFSCSETALDAVMIDSLAQRPGGWAAIGTKGDALLSNAFTQVVIAGLTDQTNLDPNGGSIVDLATPGKNNDAVNQILQVTGILPKEAAHYTKLEVIDERPARVAIEVKGTLDQRPEILIFTRYELQPCDKGVRVRTEIVNLGVGTELWALGDGYWYGNRELLPFAPGAGAGWSNPAFTLLTINDVFRTFPFMSSNSHAGDQFASYSTASCTDPLLEGFQSDVVAFAGLKRTVVPPRGYEIYERFISVLPDKSIAAATDQSFEIRRQVLGEKFFTLSGQVEQMGTAIFDSERKAVIQVSEGAEADAPEKRIPWNTVTPNEKGLFSMRVPAGKKFFLEVHQNGHKLIGRDLPAVNADLTVDPLVLPPATAQITFAVTDGDSNGPVDAEIFVVPADEATRTAVTGSFFGQHATCSPWLGPAPGASPACNRILVHTGAATADVPAGNFYFYAFHGPFWSLARQTVTVAPNAPQSLSFAVRRLQLPLANTIGADLHVHGAASFDSSIPDLDRVLSFAASDLDVIVATDHDIVYDYGQLVKDLGLSGRMTTVTGVETTGHIPFLRIPNYDYPLVIGHYNFWPLVYDPLKPRNGGPFDEFVEPGELMDRATALKDPAVSAPLIELNHPWAEAEFGRDLGFPRALSLDMRKDLPATDDGTSGGMYVRSHNGSIHKNNDQDAQEVMNGTNNDTLLQYRAFWWYVLNQGQLKTGTANSDSHSLTDNTVGMPRNVITANTQSGPGFDIVSFNTAIRNGQVLGTNGPIIQALVEGITGDKSWSMEPFKPKDGGQVRVKVYAAPWIPVEEVRFIVNGKVVKTIAANAPAADPFGTAELLRLDTAAPLAELISGVTGDAWLVIEAGAKLMLAGDLGGGLDGSPDGIPDTTDNNGDGKVDAADVDTSTKKDAKFGPIKDPPRPADGQPGFHYSQITDGYPFAFTNPFILDRDGDSRFTAPGVKGGR